MNVGLRLIFFKLWKLQRFWRIWQTQAIPCRRSSMVDPILTISCSTKLNRQYLKVGKSVKLWAPRNVGFTTNYNWNDEFIADPWDPIIFINLCQWSWIKNKIRMVIRWIMINQTVQGCSWETIFQLLPFRICCKLLCMSLWPTSTGSNQTHNLWLLELKLINTVLQEPITVVKLNCCCHWSYWYPMWSNYQNLKPNQFSMTTKYYLNELKVLLVLNQVQTMSELKANKVNQSPNPNSGTLLMIQISPQLWAMSQYLEHTNLCEHKRNCKFLHRLLEHVSVIL